MKTHLSARENRMCYDKLVQDYYKKLDAETSLKSEVSKRKKGTWSLETSKLALHSKSNRVRNKNQKMDNTVKEKNKDKNKPSRLRSNQYYLLRRYIELQRKRFKEEFDEKVQLSVETRPEFTSYKHNRNRMNPLIDYTYNPKNTLRLVNKIKSSRRQERIDQMIEIEKGSKISRHLQNYQF